MVNFHDPATISHEAWAVVKLWHTVDGLYIWEFVTTLDYEWSVIRGRRQYMWTIWIYSLARVSGLVAITLNMVGFDATRPLNCQVWIIFTPVFGYVAIASATLLIALRTIAIWKKNKIVTIVAMGTWLTNCSFLIYSTTQLHAIWVPAQHVCGVLNSVSSRHNIIATLVTDVILLLIMLLGLSRLHLQGRTSSFVRLLWKQGIIWLLIACVAEIPPAVLIILNLNDPLNLMLQIPAAIAVLIAATRMYRSLANFHVSDSSQDGPQNRVVSGTKQISTVPISFNRMEVAVHRYSEQDPGSQSQASQYGLYVKTDG